LVRNEDMSYNLLFEYHPMNIEHVIGIENYIR